MKVSRGKCAEMLRPAAAIQPRMTAGEGGEVWVVIRISGTRGGRRRVPGSRTCPCGVRSGAGVVGPRRRRKRRGGRRTARASRGEAETAAITKTAMANGAGTGAAAGDRSERFGGGEDHRELGGRWRRPDRDRGPCGSRPAMNPRRSEPRRSPRWPRRRGGALPAVSDRTGCRQRRRPGQEHDCAADDGAAAGRHRDRDRPALQRVLDRGAAPRNRLAL